MPVEVILPRVDMDMATGRISRWYVANGARVAKDQPIFELETDKAAMEVEAPAAGIIRDITGAEGEQLPVGSTVAWIYGEGEAHAPLPGASASIKEESPRVAAASMPNAAPKSSQREQTSGETTRVRATPLARRLARENGLDLSTLSGSGPHHRVQRGDVIAALNEMKQNDAATPARVSMRARVHRVWLRRGEGAPIVLIHGFGSDLNSWRVFVAALPAGRNILGLDLPGHGQSPLGDITSIDDLVEATESCLRDEGVQQAILVGHSLGGVIAAMIAERGRINARALMLIAPAGLGPEINHGFLSGFARARHAASVGAWMRELVVDEAVIQGFIAPTAAQRADGRLGDMQEKLIAKLFPDGTQAFSIRSALAALSIPVKIVVGAQDRVIPIRHANNVPGLAAQHIFPRVGHMPQLEATDAVATLLRELMRA